MLFLIISIIYFLTICFNIPYSIVIYIANVFIMLFVILLIIGYKFINDIETDDTVIGYKKSKHFR
jgi:hypothetical protein